MTIGLFSNNLFKNCKTLSFSKFIILGFLAISNREILAMKRAKRSLQLVVLSNNKKVAMLSSPLMQTGNNYMSSDYNQLSYPRLQITQKRKLNFSTGIGVGLALSQDSYRAPSVSRYYRSCRDFLLKNEQISEELRRELAALLTISSYSLLAYSTLERYFIDLGVSGDQANEILKYLYYSLPDDSFSIES